MLRSNELGKQSLSSSLKFILERWLVGKVRTMVPGEIVEVTGADRIIVRPHLDHVLTDGTTMQRPLLVDVPLFVLGSSGWRIRFPVKVGDLVILLWSERGLGAWKDANYQQAVAGLPFAQTGCIAIPVTPHDAPDNLVIENQSGSAKLELREDGTIEIVGNVSITGDLSVSGNYPS